VQRLVRDLAQEPQRDIADLQLRAHRERDAPSDPHAFDERAVAAAEVARVPRFVDRAELGVLARDRRGEDDELALLAAADAGLRRERVRVAEAIDDPRDRIGRLDRGAHVIGDQAIARRDLVRARAAQHADLLPRPATQTRHRPIEPRGAPR